MSDPINVQEVMREIRERIRHSTVLRLSKQDSVPSLPIPGAPDWTRLEEAGRALQDAGLLIGQLPPEPPTFRGQVGAFLVKIVRRALFWYTSQIFEFHKVAARSFGEQLAAIKTVADEGRQSWAVLDTLNRQVAELRAETERLEQILAVQRKEVHKIVKMQLLPETQARQLMQVHLEDATHKLGETTVRLDREIAAREKLDGQLIVEAHKQMSLETHLDGVVAASRVLHDEIKTEIEAREWLARSLRSEADLRKQLSLRLDSEIASREDMAQAQRAETLVREKLAKRVETEIALRETLTKALGEETGAREDLAQRVDAEARRIDAEAVAREGLAQALGAETGAREDLARRLDAEAAAREGLAHGLSDEMRAREALAKRLDEEITALEWVTSAHNAATGAREALAGRLESEIQVRENLSRDLGAAVNRANVLEAEFRQSGIRVERLRAEVINQSRRVSILLEEARKRLPEPFDQEQLTILAQEDMHALDPVYILFEDRFRGTREEIKDRFRVYLPLLSGQDIGSAEMPILDVGCGRGEWLELLKLANLKASGIDTNRALLADCKEKGFDVAEDDVLHYLRSLPDASMGAVTGFHIIEHLPLDVLIKVFDETVRVLKPGGMAIFETPNPQNVLVGSHNFYLDPTHRNPLPSLTIQFLLEARGLCDVLVLNLHPYPESAKLAEDGSDITRRFNEYFYGPQDYAVIGRRS